MKYDKTYTIEEIDAMLERNENFKGSTVNFQKLQQYSQLVLDAVTLFKQCDEIKAIEHETPSRRQRNASVYIDIGPLMLLNKDDLSVLDRLIQRADQVAISSVPETTRLSFCVEDIWSEKEDN